MIMYVYLPKRLIAKAIANHLMGFFVIRDKESQLPIQLAMMTMNNIKTTVRYYPLDGNEDFIHHFGAGVNNDRFPKSIIEELLSDEDIDEYFLIDLVGVVNKIEEFLEDHKDKFSTAYFDTPFSVVENK